MKNVARDPKVIIDSVTHIASRADWEDKKSTLAVSHET
mgnify:CR=1 FL=1